MCLAHAAALRDICTRLSIPFIFKASYDKANRTSLRSFRGPGIKRGLEILQRVKARVRVAVISDVHDISEVRAAGQVLDVLQIPALLCRQTDLLVAAGRTGKPVNVKKGQFVAPLDMKPAIDKITGQKNERIILTERGSSFGYNNLVSDMRAIAIMKQWGYPVVFDATHSVQLPSAGHGASAGEAQFVPTLALSAVAAGCDGLFLEVHAKPAQALCDGPNMVDFAGLERILRQAKEIWKIVRSSASARPRL